MITWADFWKDVATRDIDAGYYKIRGPMIGTRRMYNPVRLFWDGPEDWETGEPTEDQELKGEWAPHPRQVYWRSFDLLNKGHWLSPIDKEEFEWLIALKTL